MRIVPVILSGGMGVRLWPLSRRARPKQFFKLGGEETLIIETMQRVCDSEIYYPAVFICNDEHRFMVAEQLREAKIEGCEILLEPEARNTGPAIASAAAFVKEQYGDAVMLVLPSDHLIQNTEAFTSAVYVAEQAARIGKIVTFGIEANVPETGYGYIEAGAVLDNIDGALEVASFTEKPDKETATGFIQSGRHYWNGGIFVMTADTALNAFDKISPGVVDVAKAAIRDGRRDLDFLRLDADAYGAMPRESFDRLVMEKSDLGVVIPVSMGWSDIGSWDSLWRTLPHDKYGNAILGGAVLVDSQDCLVHAEHGLATVVGANGLVVVVTDDSVLVMDRSKSQDLRSIVDGLHADHRSEVETTKRVHRPWGTYQEIDRGEGFRAKRITVRPGGQLSLQRHEHRAEHWVVVCGLANVTKGDDEVILEANQSIYIPAGEKHRLENRTKHDLHLIEVQTGDYLEEDDIVRFDDSYGRD